MQSNEKKRARAGIVRLRDGSRTEVIIMRCSPQFKRAVLKVAKLLGVPISRALEELATQSLNGQGYIFGPKSKTHPYAKKQ